MSPQASSSANELDDLLKLISSSVEVVKSEYAKQGHGIPSLDSATPHTVDDVLPGLELKRAIQTLEGACAQLTAIVAPPAHTIVNRGMAGYELACIRIVTETKVAGILKAAGEAGLSVTQLSAKVGIEVGKLGRIMRFLATKHIFRETKKDVFVNNRLSILLAPENELSSLSLHFTDECFKSAAGLYDALSDPEYGPSYAPDMAPFTKVYNLPDKMSGFTWFEENPHYAERFGRGMIGWGKATGSGALQTTYPWASLPRSSTITDVGGGIGHISLSLAREFPQLKFVIQDLPGTIEQGREFWKKEYPEAIEEQRVHLQSFDFLKEEPIPGSEIYYLRHIIHDWPDKECVQILKNVKKAMKPGSKVLIHEYILQHVNRVSEDEAAFVQAPEPLLPNYGVGRIRQYNLDLDMMCMLNARERTLEEFVKLGEESGLKFTKLYDTGETGIVEFELPKPRFLFR